jgi:formylglycine-generating enzyme required for sulfatase activity
MARRSIGTRSLRVAITSLALLLAIASASAPLAAREPTKSAPDEVMTNSIGMKLVLIPAGEFEMGSPADKEGHVFDESPVHRVRITKPFYLGQYEVTLGEFLKFYHATGYKTDAEKDGGGMGYTGTGDFPFAQRADFVPWHWGFDGQTNDHPVVNVSWNDVVAFCEWLSRKEGRTYRLPTEAEWEYACRSGTTTRFSIGDGDSDLHHVANCEDSSLKRFFKRADGKHSDGFPFTAPVGSLRPNVFGLYDMHGNVWEWCSDWYDENYYRHSPLGDPPGPSTGSERVFRGGGWFNSTLNCRSAQRWSLSPASRNDDIGFRVACAPR